MSLVRTAVAQSSWVVIDFIWRVVPAGDTSCQPPAPKNPATVTPNVTTTIHTCEPWGLRVTGGVKPYQISLAALGSQFPTNVTMGPDDEVLVYIDRALPGQRLLGACHLRSSVGIEVLMMCSYIAAVVDASV